MGAAQAGECSWPQPVTLSWLAPKHTFQPAGVRLATHPHKAAKRTLETEQLQRTLIHSLTPLHSTRHRQQRLTTQLGQFGPATATTASELLAHPAKPGNTAVTKTFPDSSHPSLPLTLVAAPTMGVAVPAALLAVAVRGYLKAICTVTGVVRRLAAHHLLLWCALAIGPGRRPVDCECGRCGVVD